MYYFSFNVPLLNHLDLNPLTKYRRKNYFFSEIRIFLYPKLSLNCVINGVDPELRKVTC